MQPMELLLFDPLSLDDAELPLFCNFWKPGNVGEFGKVRKKAESPGKVREFV